jgi:hypothetical protein
MENTIEIAPNQLPLFDMLTTEQEIELARLKTLAKRDADKHEKRISDKIELLLKAGFTNRHYTYNVERTTVTREVNVANWRDYSKLVEDEFDSVTGDCYLLYSRYDKSKNEIVTAKTWFDVYSGKIECCNLTGSYRKYKPETILAQIEESYEIATNEYDIANKTKSTVEYTINKYKKLYPDAEVKAGRGYNSGRGNYSEFDTVTIKFKSGSYVVFEVYATPDREYVREKVDAVTKKLAINELMDYFNAQ